MKKHAKFEEWHHIIAVNEQTFISSTMDKAAKYLRDARNEEGDWGYYKGLPTNIHASSLAIEALQISSGKGIESFAAEDATVRMRSVISSNLDSYGIQELVDLLNILSGSESRDSELELRLVAHLNDLSHDVGWGDPELSISLSCRVILAYMNLEKPPQDIIKRWIDYLVKFQRSEDGGWGATPDSKSDIIPTCQALRVLNRYSDKSLAEIRSASFEFLRDYFKSKNWNDLNDTFTITTVLRTLGEIEDFPFEIMQEGIDSLYERVNLDGGWGVEKGKTSNVEHTALSIIALSSAGENKFVPSKLIKATLEAAKAEIMKLRNEKERLSEEIDIRVKKEVKNVIQQRNELQQKVNSLEEEVSNLEEKVSEMKSELRASRTKREFIAPDAVVYGRNIQKLSFYSPILKTIVLLMAIVSSSYFFLGGITDLFLLIVVISVTILIGYFFILRTRKFQYLKWNELKLSPERRIIVYDFIDLLAEWPPSKREDFLFQLAKEVENIPFEDTETYIRYLSEKYGERESQYRRLLDTLFRFMTLPPSARLVVIDEIRMRLYDK